MSDGRSSDIRYYKRRRRLKVLMVPLPRNTLLFLTIVEIVETASSRVGVLNVPPFPCSRHYRVFVSSNFSLSLVLSPSLYYGTKTMLSYSTSSEHPHPTHSMDSSKPASSNHRSAGTPSPPAWHHSATPSSPPSRSILLQPFRSHPILATGQACP